MFASLKAKVMAFLDEKAEKETLVRRRSVDYDKLMCDFAPIKCS
jgi:hypothetical protein